ncbi:MAG: histidine kinase [Pseudoflavonifractor sp.]
MRSITVKITAVVSVLVLLITLLSSSFVLLFFRKVLTEEKLNSDRYVLRQHCAQLETLVQEVRTIAQNVILDPRIQTFCREERPDYAKITEMADYLSRQTGVRVYFHSAAVIAKGQVYWNAYPTDRFFQRILEEDWYSAMAGSGRRYAFSAPHRLSYGYHESIELVTYGAKISDPNVPAAYIGQLLLNLDADYLRQTVSQWDTTYSTYALFSGTRVLSHSAGPEWPDRPPPPGQRVPLEAGWLQSDGVEGTDWVLYSYTSNAALFGRVRYLLLFFAVFTPATIAVMLLCIAIFVRRLTRPIGVLAQGMQAFSQGEMDTYVDIRSGDELEGLAGSFNQMVERINAYILTAVENEKIKKKIKFDMLISKIHPHFIYNTLNSVIYIARKQGQDDIVQMTRALILILQDSMSVHSDQLYDRAATERGIVEAYGLIQNYRYKGRITLEFLWDPGSDDWSIPKNILQPLVENAIFHGIAPKGTAGTIEVTLRREAEQLLLAVADDGVGMDEATRLRVSRGEQAATTGNTVHSIGVRNIIDRLDYLYAGAYSFRLLSTPGLGTRAEIILPWREVEP